MNALPIVSLFLLILARFHPVSCDCSTELLSRASLSASSFASPERGPQQAILNGKSKAWTAAQSDFGQYLLIDLGKKYNIAAISTKGRQFSFEYVQEYRLEYGIDGRDYSIYRDRNGNIKLFEGNYDDNTAKSNYFEPPIIAQYIRINPTRWTGKISMRVQLYGCDYVAESINFDGQSYVSLNIKNRQISSYEDLIRFRFRTNEANGNIMYSKGTQGDLLSLRMENNKLVLTLDLGGDSVVNRISAGSLLDDNLWHDVLISRSYRDLLFTVDRIVVRKVLAGSFLRMDLNNEIFIGGLPLTLQYEMEVRENFTGCLENLMLNNTNIVSEMKYDLQQYTYRRFGDVLFACRFPQVMPVTFTTAESHFKVDGFFSDNVQIGLHFRTFNEDGLLVYNKFSSVGLLQLYLDKGKILLQLQGTDTPKEPIVIDAFPSEVFNDGSWHRVSLSLQRNKIVLEVDGNPSVTTRLFSMQSGLTYLIGGGVYGMSGFIGCIRSLYILGRFVAVKSLPSDKIVSSKPGDILFDSCQMIDRCFPNPCEHGGICRQTHLDFTCDCTHTGYAGAVCRIARNPLSCRAHFIDHPGSKRDDIDIDVDGSGPLEPFPVTCKFDSNSQTYTVLHHQNEAATTVQGYAEPGSFMQDIAYNAQFEQIIGMVNRSLSCRQHLRYECLNARLLNTPYASARDPNLPYIPFTWWVSRDNQKMDYWGGSLPGTRRCACGLSGSCRDSRRWCNCDSTGGLLTDSWLMDEGEIVQKDYLPVRQLRVGDTGATISSTKMARFTLGPLECEGDRMFDNVITFRYRDAVIKLPPFEVEYSADIYFQFKTTVEKGVFLHGRGVSDFIKLAITGEKIMQLTYNFGFGPQEIAVETSYRINDDQWHSVLIEVNKKEAKLIVDGKFPKSKSHTAPFRPSQLSSNLVLGANVNYGEGYVGCMRAFMLNGRFVDLVYLSNDYGLSPGCIGKCASNPCLNNGTCLEGYSSYTCDCQWTAFKGVICADEIGVNLRSENYIRYDLENPISTLEENIHVGFTTTEHKGLILGISAYTGEYLNLVMSTSGNLRLVFDFGFERQEIIIRNENFALGQHHDLTIKRHDRGTKLVILVDNYEPIIHTYTLGAKTDAQFTQIKSIYVGRNETMDSGEGFVGCISRVSFDDHFPIRRLFQLDRRSNVHAYPSYDSVREDTCGIESVTHPPEIPETRAPPPYRGPVRKDSVASTAGAIIGGIIAGLIVIIVIACIASGRFVSRHKGDYVTHEDKGAKDALDPDTAVVKGKTGPDISKKKEYFI